VTTREQEARNRYKENAREDKKKVIKIKDIAWEERREGVEWNSMQEKQNCEKLWSIIKYVRKECKSINISKYDRYTEI
jgi:hypothetical protein